MAEKMICGICKGEIKEEEREIVGFLKFPDGETRPCHLTHNGAEEEWKRQRGVK